MRKMKRPCKALRMQLWLVALFCLVSTYVPTVSASATIDEINLASPTEADVIQAGHSGYWTTTMSGQNNTGGNIIVSCVIKLNGVELERRGWSTDREEWAGQCSFIMTLWDPITVDDRLVHEVCVSWNNGKSSTCSQKPYSGLVSNTDQCRLSIDVLAAPANSSTISVGADDCNSTQPYCYVLRDANETVSLIPNTTSITEFVSWGDDCNGSGACEITMDCNRQVSGVFLKRDDITEGNSQVKAGKDGTSRRIDYTGNSQDLTCPSVAKGDPLIATNGSYVEHLKLFEIYGAIPMPLYLTYESRKASRDSGFWFGPSDIQMNHNYDMRLREVAPDVLVEVRWPDNRQSAYEKTANGDFKTKIGDEQEVLIQNADGSYTLTDRFETKYEFDGPGGVVRITDRSGFSLELTYLGDDPASWLIAVTEPISGKSITFTTGTHITISAPGVGTVQREALHDNVVKVIDALGGEWGFTYGNKANLLTKTNPLGKTIVTNTYDPGFWVQTQDDALASTPLSTLSYETNATTGNLETTYTARDGGVTKYIMDGGTVGNNLAEVVDELGNSTSFNYDANANRMSTTDALGNMTTRTRDAFGLITSKTDQNGLTTHYEYDSSRNRTKVIFPDGAFREWTYDSRNNVNSFKDENGDLTTYTYDSDGLPESILWPGGATRTFVYTNGQLESESDETNKTTTYGYDAAGRLNELADPAGKKWTWVYDLLGRLTSETDPLGNTTTYTYDAASQLKTIEDPKGNITAFTYNDNGKLTEVENPLNDSVFYGYDHEDRLTSIIDERGKVTTLTRDAKGRVTHVTDPEGNVTTTVYDALGRVIERIDALNNKSYFVYDSAGLLQNTVTPLGFVTGYRYDARYRATRMVDALGRLTDYRYDDVGRQIQTRDALGNSGHQAFDSDGLRTSLADANGNATDFTYDNAGRLLSAQTEDGGTQSLTYNSRGLVDTFTNARSQVASHTYDDAGRLTQITDPAGTITYTYDDNDNLLTANDSVGNIVRTYDALDRLASFTDAFGNTIGYAYDKAGNLETLTYPDNKVVTYGYDDNNRMTTVTDWNSRVTSYTWEGTGRLKTTTHSNGVVTTYNHDNDSRLIYQEERRSDNTLIHKYNYTYDSTDNILTEDEFPLQVPSPSTANMTYGDDNRLATFDANAVIYDADGNMTSGPLNGTTKTYTYDARSRLTSIDGTTYVYDAEDRRVSTTKSGITTRYVIDPNASLSRTLMEADGAGSPIAYYVYGLGLIGRESSTGDYLSYHYDYRGSTRILTDNTEATTDRYFYGPYGKVVNTVGSTDQPFKYNGRDGVTTDDNGLYHMRARYYLPEAKRFVNRDSLLGEIHNALTFNRFAYVSGNPIYSIDPTGHQASKKPNKALANIYFTSGVFGEERDNFHRELFRVYEWKKKQRERDEIHGVLREDPVSKQNRMALKVFGRAQLDSYRFVLENLGPIKGAMTVKKLDELIYLVGKHLTKEAKDRLKKHVERLIFEDALKGGGVRDGKNQELPNGCPVNPPYIENALP